MNVALCFSGYCRSLPSTFQYIKRHWIDAFQPDIFFAGWAEAEVSNAVTLLNPKSYHVFSPDAVRETLELQAERINELNIRRVRVESSERVETTRGIQRFPSAAEIKESELSSIGMAIGAQFLQVQTSIRLALQYSKIVGKRYDIIIRARPDTVFFTDRSLYRHSRFEDFRSGYSVDQNPMGMVPVREDEVYTVAIDRINRGDVFAVNDYFYYGSQSAMGHLANIWDEYEKTMQLIAYGGAVLPLSGINESILSAYLARMGVSMIAPLNASTGVYSRILRSDGSLI